MKKFRNILVIALMVLVVFGATGCGKKNTNKTEKKEDNTYVTIETSYFQLTYRKEAPYAGPKMSPDQNLKISLKNTDKYWYFNHPEVRNFGGTSFSLDGADGNVKYNKGLY